MSEAITAMMMNIDKEISTISADDMLCPENRKVHLRNSTLNICGILMNGFLIIRNNSAQDVSR